MPSEHEIYQRLAALEAMRGAQKDDRRAIQENRRRIRSLEQRDHHIDNIPTYGERIRRLEDGYHEMEGKIGDLKNYLESRFWVMAAIAGGLLTALELAFKLLPA